MWNKDILKQTELERINHQYSNLKINTKSISTGRKRMIPEMQEEIESDRKGEYVLKFGEKERWGNNLCFRNIFS